MTSTITSTFNRMMNIRSYNENIKYLRNHPLLPDWPEWKEIVYIYHSEYTRILQKRINKGNKLEGDFRLDELDEQMIRDIYWETNIKIARSNFTTWDEIFEDVDFIEGDDMVTMLYNARVHMISLIWAFVYVSKSKRHMRKYYKQLERVVLSLPYNYLKKFTLELIVDPPKFHGRTRNLLKDVYERAYFDNINCDRLVQRFEYLKHFIRQQGGTFMPTNQSYSEHDLFVPGCLEEGFNLANKYSFKKFMSLITPKSQGLFPDSMTHDHNITDAAIFKFKELICDSQRNFLDGLKDTLVSTGQQLFVLFATATTISLLSKVIVSASVSIVLKLLHMMYAFICGPDTYDDINKSYVACSQSGDDISIPFIPSMILNYIISPPREVLKTIWKSSQTDMIMRRIGYLGDPKIDRGIERMIDWVKNIIKQIEKWYGLEILGLFGINAISDDCCPIANWYDRVDQLIKTYFSGDFVWSDTSFGVVHQLYSEGLGFTRQQAYHKYKFDVYNCIRKLGNILEQFKSHGCSTQQIRNPPVTIYLYGGTGVGKSSITYPLAAEILKGIFEKEKNPIDLRKCWKNLIYMRAPEQEYWDGYENQLVTVFDDFSQQRDTESKPNVELFEIIRSSNCFPYPLHMAAIDQKANTTFTSKVIIVSSNLNRPQVQSLNFPDALRRRFDICVEVDRSFNGHTNKFDPTLYKLNEYDINNGAHLGSLSYKEMVNRCIDSYFQRKSYVQTMEDYIVGTLNESEDKVTTEVQTDLEYEDEGFNNICDIFEPESNDYHWDVPAVQQGNEVDDINEFQDTLEDLEEETMQPNEIEFMQQLFKSERLQLLTDQIINEQLDLMATQNNVDKGLFKAVVKNGNPGCSYWKKQVEEENKNKDPVYCVMNNCYKVGMSAKPLIEKSFESLKIVIDKCKLKIGEMQEWWVQFRSKHIYLNKAIMYIGIMIAGLMFLKVFNSLKNMTTWDKKKDVVMTESEFINGKRLARSERTQISKAESYNLVPPKVAKKESYTTVQPKVAKIEAYTPVQTQVAKIESTPVAEGVKDINAAEILMKCVRSNLYKMYESTQGVAIGHVMFLVGKICVMPKHYLSALHQSLKNDKNATVYFEAVLLNRCFETKVSDLINSIKDYESPDEDEGPVHTRDLVSACVESSICHSDATSYFCTKGSLSRCDATEVMLPVLCKNNLSEKPVLLIRYAEGRSQLKRIESVPVADHETVICRYVRDCWQYNLDTRDTECGAPLIVRNTQINPGKICGLHIAGIAGMGQGFSTPFYYEDAIKIVKMYPVHKSIQHQINLKLKEYPPVEQCQIPVNAEFLRLGAIEKPIAQVAKTKIVPSPIYEMIRPCVTKPCLLSVQEIDGKMFSPRTYRLERLGNKPVAIDQELINNSRDALIDEMSSVFSQSKDLINENIKGHYTFEEACLGIPGEDYINSVKRDTSAGFPFIQIPMFTRKDIFGNGEEYDLNSTQCNILRRRVENIIENAKQNIALDHYFVDTLKDERKPIHKAHKSRLFSAGPIDYLIACKMYFNGVVALMSKTRNLCHVSVGTNVYSRDWSVIVESLQRKSKEMIAGDFEGFDASQHRALLEACGEVIIELSRRFCGSTEEDVQIMRVLMVSLLNSLHITGKEVYEWTHSLPSGHYLTAIINSVFVNIAFGCVWQLARGGKPSYIKARSFWNMCGITAYGDDHIVSVPRSFLDIFNQMTIPKLMAKIGLSYTMEEKEREADMFSRKIEEINFLKRGFRYISWMNQWVCPLNLDTVLEFPMWNRRCTDPVAQTIVELNKCFEELSLHTPSVWKLWSPKLHEVANELGHYPEYYDQDETMQICLGHDEYLL